MVLPENVFDPGQAYIEHCFRVPNNKQVFLLVAVSVQAQKTGVYDPKTQFELCLWIIHTLFQ